MPITSNSCLSIAYLLRYDDKNGDVIEEISEQEPLNVQLGTGELLDKIENHILGLSSGDHFELTVQPEDAYGDYEDDLVTTIPIEELFPDGDTVPLEPGDVVPIKTDDDEEMHAIILEVDGQTVTLDFNHPLAGETLFFAGKIVTVVN
ncbi:hypothetical protein FACS1894201_00730 [Bacteroidia bacterium]|nr:hypothetical protein FACS1894201_00730 [Bacteroidia bacterium]